MPTLSLDLETPYGKDFSVTEYGYWKYARDPRQAPYMISVCDGASSWSGEPKHFNWDTLTGVHLVSHNSGFDEEIALAMAEKGEWPSIKHAGWDCTLDMSAFLFNVRSLKDAALIGLGVEVAKDVRNAAKDKSWAQMVAEGTSQAMMDYALKDAQYCWQLWDKYSDRWPEFERRLSRLTREQGRHGVQMDVEKIDEGIRLMQQVILTATNNLPWIARGRKPASPIGLHEQCRIEGIPCPPVKVHDPEGAVEWEEMFAPKHRFVLALRNLRKAKKALATLETMKLRLRPDNTMAFSLKYAGAHTLRWAGDGGLNFQNFAKEPLFVKDGEFQFDTKALNDAFRKDEEMPSGVLYLDMRGLIIARPGYVLAPVDEAQIEPRMLNWLAGNFKLLKLVAQGYAIYEAYARAVEGYEGPSIKDNDPNYYQYLKVKVLGLGYGAGWEKAIVIGKIYGVDLTEKDEHYAKLAAVDGKIYQRRKDALQWVYSSVPEGVDGFYLYYCIEGTWTEPKWDEKCVFVKKIRWVNKEAQEYIVAQPVLGQQARYEVAKFRKDNPEIVALWKTMQGELEASIGGNLKVQGPHGGFLTYRNVRREARTFTDPETDEVTKRIVITAEVGNKREIFHGPKLTENLTQWVARMVFAEGLLRAKEAGLVNLFSVHDEDVPEIPLSAVEEYGEAAVKKSIEALFSVTPTWLPGCPIAAECKLTPRYKK